MRIIKGYLREQPKLVEAAPLDDYDQCLAVMQWCGGRATDEGDFDPAAPLFYFMDGGREQAAVPGDYIVKFSDGEFMRLGGSLVASSFREHKPTGVKSMTVAMRFAMDDLRGYMAPGPQVLERVATHVLDSPEIHAVRNLVRDLCVEHCGVEERQDLDSVLEDHGIAKHVRDWLCEVGPVPERVVCGHCHGDGFVPAETERDLVHPPATAFGVPLSECDDCGGDGDVPL